MPQSRSLLRFTFASFLALLLCSAYLPAQESQQSAVSHAKALSRAFRQAADAARPSVVTVLVHANASAQRDALRQLFEGDPRLRELFPDDEGESEGDEESEITPDLMHVGSGIIVDAGGVILTNHHVVAAAEKVTIRLVDGQEYVARDIISDSMSDLAILRIDANVPLTAAKLGDSDEMNIGDWVIAIGSPFELETTVSAGIISAKGRGIDKIKRGRLLQTDAAINPGNSGGPLVNLDGEVIGISTAIATSYGGYQGVGFAIPANRAKWVWSELSNHGTVRRASLGIGIGELDAQQAAQFEMTARSGVWVRRVYPNSAGAEAGLKEDDVIIEFAGEPVQMPRDLQDLVEQTAIGAKVPVKVRRNGQVLVLDVVPKELD